MVSFFNYIKTLEEKRKYFMIKRKHYLINKKYQLKNTMLVVGMSLFCVAIIIIAISINISNNNKKLENIIFIQNNVVETLLTLSQNNQDRAVKIAINNAGKNHYDNILTIRNIIELNTTFLILILVIAIIQSLILYFIMIRKTHKISGPEYVISSYITEILKGKIPNVRALRKGDELNELHNLFVKLINYLKENKKI